MASSTSESLQSIWARRERTLRLSALRGSDSSSVTRERWAEEKISKNKIRHVNIQCSFITLSKCYHHECTGRDKEKRRHTLFEGLQRLLSLSFRHQGVTSWDCRIRCVPPSLLFFFAPLLLPFLKTVWMRMLKRDSKTESTVAVKNIRKCQNLTSGEELCVFNKLVTFDKFVLI